MGGRPSKPSAGQPRPGQIMAAGAFERAGSRRPSRRQDGAAGGARRSLPHPLAGGRRCKLRAAGLGPTRRPVALYAGAARAVAGGRELIDRLVASDGVRWDLCLRTCVDLGVTAAIELAPGQRWADIAKRELRGAELLAIKSPDDLDQARASRRQRRRRDREEVPVHRRPRVAAGWRHSRGRGCRLRAVTDC